MKPKTYTVIRIGISLLLVGLLFYMQRDTLNQTFDVIKKLDFKIFLISFFIFLLSVILLSARLKIILCAQGLILKFSEAIYLTFIGFFFNNFLPTSIGGDVVKAYYTSKKTNNKIDSFISVFMDRFVGFLTLFALSGVSLFFGYGHINNKSLVLYVLLILFLLLFISAIFLNRRLASNIFSLLSSLINLTYIKEKIRIVYNAINAYKDKRPSLAKAISISLIAQIVSFSIAYIIARGMGVFISIKIVLLLMPLISIASMFPSINGLGIREGAIYVLFGPYLGYKNAFALGLIHLFMLFLISIIGGIIYLLQMQYRIKGGGVK